MSQQLSGVVCLSRHRKDFDESYYVFIVLEGKGGFLRALTVWPLPNICLYFILHTIFLSTVFGNAVLREIDSLDRYIVSLYAEKVSLFYITTIHLNVKNFM